MDSSALGKLPRIVAALVATLAAAIAVGACGSSTKVGNAASDFSPISGSAVHLLITSWPQSLDPQADSSSEGRMLNWQVYTGLTTFRHATGANGTQVIPGLATGLPTVSDGGRQYTVTLRSGLVFSNGRAVHASDFAYTVERAIRLRWSGSAAFLEPLIKGAGAYANGAASTISGIVTDDQTRTITIHLTRPYPAFDEILAQPALGMIPSGTPMRNKSIFPPAGVGPYIYVDDVVPNQTLQLIRNPLWAQMKIPGIPAGYGAINVRLDPSSGAAALSVLNNSYDLLDSSTSIPSAIAGQIKRLAPTRLYTEDFGASTDYIFMNVRQRPFNNALVREAVTAGLNRQAMAAVSGSGVLRTGCTLLPPAISGHLTGGSCSSTGNLGAARALIKRSGEAGTAVTVWSPPTTPEVQWMTQYTAMLNAIGLKATLRVVNQFWSVYWIKVGTQATGAQTGYASWTQSFPSPLSFYGTLLYGPSIGPYNNSNLGQIDDPRIDSTVDTLGTRSTDTSSQWASLESYVQGKDYLAVIGYPASTLFVSDRIAAHVPGMSSPVYGWDLSRVHLQSSFYDK